MTHDDVVRFYNLLRDPNSSKASGIVPVNVLLFRLSSTRLVSLLNDSDKVPEKEQALSLSFLRVLKSNRPEGKVPLRPLFRAFRSNKLDKFATLSEIMSFKARLLLRSREMRSVRA